MAGTAARVDALRAPVAVGGGGSAAMAVIAWLLTFAVLGSAAVAAAAMHDDIVKAWPATERAYRAVGFT